METFKNQLLMQNLASIKRSKMEWEIQNELTKIKTTNLSEITWVGDKTKTKLIEAWVDTLEKLKQMSKEEISAIITNPLSREQIFSYLKI